MYLHLALTEDTVLYVHSLMSYEDLCATINPHTNRRSRKIKTILNICTIIIKLEFLKYHVLIIIVIIIQAVYGFVSFRLKSPYKQAYYLSKYVDKYETVTIWIPDSFACQGAPNLNARIWNKFDYQMFLKSDFKCSVNVQNQQ